MLLLLIGLLLLVVFDITAMRWGYDSRDRLESQEWKRRNQCGFFLGGPYEDIEALGGRNPC
jgi:hypothetical protein